MTGRPLVIIDSVADPADTLCLVEHWLHSADVDGGGGGDRAVALQAGIQAAAALGVVLQSAFDAAPALYAPGRRLQVAPVAVVSFDLDTALQAVCRAVTEAAGAPDPPPTMVASVELLGACAAAAGSVDTRLLADVAAPGPEKVFLDDRQYRTYRRFAAAVLTNPLDRLIAMTSDIDPAAFAAGDAVGSLLHLGFDW